MVNVLDAASYVCKRYKDSYGTSIDEMKLHKLLYFAQRESLIQTGEPLFEAVFRGWKYGPILREIRDAFKNNSFSPVTNQRDLDELKRVMNPVFEAYAGKDSWSLSRLTHGEISWTNSRKGIAEEQNSDNPISLDDIRIDAERIKERREMLAQLGIS